MHRCNEIVENASKVVVGKRRAMELLTVALIAEGHILLEDVPGLGKTLMAKALAQSIGGSFKRIQFTPDLLPADVTGFSIYDQKKGEFVFHPGPIMTNILLADEINRTIPRTQASLLESMGEFQVTVDGQTIVLPRPFFVIATQNPIEMDGTFPLPEAQLDRFLMRIDLGYPSIDEEVEILERFREKDPLKELEAIATPEKIVEYQYLRSTVKISLEVKRYIAEIVAKTRTHPLVRFGVSPRGAIGLMRASQALAVMRDREYVLPDDVKELAVPVLLHRIILRHDERTRGADAQTVVDDVLADTKVPVPA